MRTPPVTPEERARWGDADETTAVVLGSSEAATRASRKYFAAIKPGDTVENRVAAFARATAAYRHVYVRELRRRGVSVEVVRRARHGTGSTAAVRRRRHRPTSGRRRRSTAHGARAPSGKDGGSDGDGDPDPPASCPLIQRGRPRFNLSNDHEQAALAAEVPPVRLTHRLPSVSHTLNTNIPTLRAWIRRGDLQAFKIGRSVYVADVDLREFIERHRRRAGLRLVKKESK